MSKSRLRCSSLFEMIAASGLCPIPLETDLLNDSEPCDKSLLDVLHQLEALVTGNMTPATPEFVPSSNFVAMLAIGWLAAQENALEILLQRTIFSAGTGVTKKQDCQLQLQPVCANEKALYPAWSRLRLSFRCLAAVMQQHASLLHRAQQWLPRGKEQQRALKAYLHWKKEEQHLLWQALLARHPHGSTELQRYKARLHHPLNVGSFVDQLTVLAERFPGFRP
ncbi:uncharacterized protein LOC119166841 [Rhipicephalus microplus]|uniref:uncharacterized protein LOC119166841 n=1 Tax=Rhipicephalus microplus TaxID=6941 RepID=UPI003F6CB077